MKKQRKKSKGLSLVELLVSVALSGFVLTMVFNAVIRGYNSYNSETKKAELQNNAQDIINTVSDALMEASKIKFDGNKTYTADTNVLGTAFATKAGKLIYFDSATGSLYITTKTDTSAQNLKGGLLAENVSDFSITIADICKTKDEEGNDCLANPVTFVVTVKLESKNVKVEYSQNVSMRNKVGKVYLNGDETSSYGVIN